VLLFNGAVKKMLGISLENENNDQITIETPIFSFENYDSDNQNNLLTSD